MEVLYFVKYNDKLYKKLNMIFGEDLVAFLLPEQLYIRNIRLIPDPRRDTDEMLKIEDIRGAFLRPVKIKKPLLVYAFNLVNDSSNAVFFLDEYEASERIKIVIPWWVLDIFSDRSSIEVEEMRTDLHFYKYDEYL